MASFRFATAGSSSPIAPSRRFATSARAPSLTTTPGGGIDDDP
jgi:hypothetical protein